MFLLENAADGMLRVALLCAKSHKRISRACAAPCSHSHFSSFRSYPWPSQPRHQTSSQGLSWSSHIGECPLTKWTPSRPVECGFTLRMKRLPSHCPATAQPLPSHCSQSTVSKHSKEQVAHKAAVDYFFEHVPGLKAAFFSIDKDEPTLVHDFQWFNNIDSFLAHGDMTNPVTKQKVMDWTSLYDPAYPMTGDVYGNWNDQVKTMTAGFGAKFDFHTSLNGFIKTTAEGHL